MSADLMIMAIELKETKDKCLKRINKLDWSDVDDMCDRFENAGVIFDRYAVEEWDEVECMKERLREAVECVYDEHSRTRDCTTLAVDGIGRFLVTGGTWDDIRGHGETVRVGVEWLVNSRNPSDKWDDFLLFHEFLCYPFWAKPNSKERKEWEKIGRKRK